MRLPEAARSFGLRQLDETGPPRVLVPLSELDLLQLLAGEPDEELVGRLQTALGLVQTDPPF